MYATNHLIISRCVTYLESHNERQILNTLGSLNHTHCTIGIGSRRLLTIDVLMSLYCSLEYEGVSIGGSSDNYGIHLVVLQQLEIGIAAYIYILLGYGLQTFSLIQAIKMRQHLVDSIAEEVSQSINLDIIVVAHSGNDAISSTITRTDKADAYGAIQLLATHNLQRAEHSECSRCSKHLQKISSIHNL